MLALFDRMVEHVRLGETSDDMFEAGVLDGLRRNVRGSGEVSVRRRTKASGRITTS